MNMFNGYNQPTYESDPGRDSSVKKAQVTPWPYSHNFYNGSETQQQHSNAPWQPKPAYPMAGKCGCAQCQQGPWYHKEEPVHPNPNNQDIMMLGPGGGGCDYPMESYPRPEAYLRGTPQVAKSFPSCSYPAPTSQGYSPRLPTVKQPTSSEYTSYDRKSEQYMRLFESQNYGRKPPEPRQKYWDGVNNPFYPAQQYQYPSSCRYPPYNPTYYYQGSSPSQPYQHPQQPNAMQQYYGIVPNPMRQVEVRPQPTPTYLKQDNTANKISPLRLMRKKKFTEAIGQPSPPRTSAPTENPPALDVRRFLATWADEDEDTSPAPQMVVLECQDINAEQAELLRLCEESTIRIIEEPAVEQVPDLRPENEQPKILEEAKELEDSQPPDVVVFPPTLPVPDEPCNTTLQLVTECRNQVEAPDDTNSSAIPSPASPANSHDSLPMLADLPTSEYRKNKFLDYDQQSFTQLPARPPPRGLPETPQTVNCSSDSAPVIPHLTDQLQAKKNSRKRSRKPTIKFSIQKSHDLKISLRVMNENKTCTENEIVPETTTECNETDSGLITLSLEGDADDLDLKSLKSKRARKLKKRRFLEQKYSVSSEEHFSDVTTDGFQVQESVDSAKIKLTFKRRRGETETTLQRWTDEDVPRKKKKGKRFKAVLDNEVVGAESSGCEAASPELPPAADTTTDCNGLPPRNRNSPDRPKEEEKNVTDGRVSPIQTIALTNEVHDPRTDHVPGEISPHHADDEESEYTLRRCESDVQASAFGQSKRGLLNEPDSSHQWNDVQMNKPRGSNTSSPKITSSCHITSPRTSTDSIERELQAIWNGHLEHSMKTIDQKKIEGKIPSIGNVVDFYTEEIPTEPLLDDTVNRPELNENIVSPLQESNQVVSKLCTFDNAESPDLSSKFEMSAKAEGIQATRVGVICHSLDFVKEAALNLEKPLDLRSSYHFVSSASDTGNVNASSLSTKQSTVNEIQNNQKIELSHEKFHSNHDSMEICCKKETEEKVIESEANHETNDFKLEAKGVSQTSEHEESNIISNIYCENAIDTLQSTEKGKECEATSSKNNLNALTFEPCIEDNSSAKKVYENQIESGRVFNDLSELEPNATAEPVLEISPICDTARLGTYGEDRLIQLNISSETIDKEFKENEVPEELNITENVLGTLLQVRNDFKGDNGSDRIGNEITESVSATSVGHNTEAENLDGRITNDVTEAPDPSLKEAQLLPTSLESFSPQEAQVEALKSEDIFNEKTDPILNSDTQYYEGSNWSTNSADCSENLVSNGSNTSNESELDELGSITGSTTCSKENFVEGKSEKLMSDAQSPHTINDKSAIRDLHGDNNEDCELLLSDQLSLNSESPPKINIIGFDVNSPKIPEYNSTSSSTSTSSGASSPEIQTEEADFSIFKGPCLPNDQLLPITDDSLTANPRISEEVSSANPTCDPSDSNTFDVIKPKLIPTTTEIVSVDHQGDTQNVSKNDNILSVGSPAVNLGMENASFEEGLESSEDFGDLAQQQLPSPSIGIRNGSCIGPRTPEGTPNYDYNEHSLDCQNITDYSPSELPENHGSTRCTDDKLIDESSSSEELKLDDDFSIQMHPETDKSTSLYSTLIKEDENSQVENGNLSIVFKTFKCLSPMRSPQLNEHNKCTRSSSFSQSEHLDVINDEAKSNEKGKTPTHDELSIHGEVDDIEEAIVLDDDSSIELESDENANIIVSNVILNLEDVLPAGSNDGLQEAANIDIIIEDVPVQIDKNSICVNDSKQTFDMVVDCGDPGTHDIDDSTIENHADTENLEEGLEEGELVENEFIVVEDITNEDVRDKLTEVDLSPQAGISMDINVAEIPLPPGEAPLENCFNIEKWVENKSKTISTGNVPIEPCDSPFTAEVLDLFRNPSPPGTPRLVMSPKLQVKSESVVMNKTEDIMLGPASATTSDGITKDLCSTETSEVDGDAVPDDAEFQDVMENCLANATRFLSRESNVVEGEIIDTEGKVADDHVRSRDVLLSSFEAPSDLEIGGGVSSADVSMDFSPFYTALGPESLPVDNWPYLEEEVPLSPSWSGKEEEVPLNEEPKESIKVEQRLNHISHPLLPRFLCTDRSRAQLRVMYGSSPCETRAQGRHFSKARRRTFDAVSNNVVQRKKFASERQCTDSDAELDILKENTAKNLKCRVSLERLAKADARFTKQEKKWCGPRNILKKNKNGEDLRVTNIANSTEASEIDLVTGNTSTFEDYKDPKWQPKVVLRRISKVANDNDQSPIIDSVEANDGNGLRKTFRPSKLQNDEKAESRESSKAFYKLHTANEIECSVTYSNGCDLLKSSPPDTNIKLHNANYDIGVTASKEFSRSTASKIESSIAEKQTCSHSSLKEEAHRTEYKHKVTKAKQCERIDIHNSKERNYSGTSPSVVTYEMCHKGSQESSSKGVISSDLSKIAIDNTLSSTHRRHKSRKISENVTAMTCINGESESSVASTSLKPNTKQKEKYENDKSANTSRVTSKGNRLSHCEGNIAEGACGRSHYISGIQHRSGYESINRKPSEDCLVMKNKPNLETSFDPSALSRACRTSQGTKLESSPKRGCSQSFEKENDCKEGTSCRDKKYEGTECSKSRSNDGRENSSAVSSGKPTSNASDETLTAITRRPSRENERCVDIVDSIASKSNNMVEKADKKSNIIDKKHGSSNNTRGLTKTSHISYQTYLMKQKRLAHEASENSSPKNVSCSKSSQSPMRTSESNNLSQISSVETIAPGSSLDDDLSDTDQPWVCGVCGFNDIEQQQIHIQEHSFHCQSCHLAFKSEAHFIRHLTRRHHDIRKLHHCLLCELSFDTDEVYQRHLLTREHTHLEAVEKRTIQTLFSLLSGQSCPVLGSVEQRPEWLPNQAGTVHFYHQATPISLAMQYWKVKQSSSKPKQ